jgi:hypothetical protein
VALLSPLLLLLLLLLLPLLLLPPLGVSGHPESQSAYAAAAGA